MNLTLSCMYIYILLSLNSVTGGSSWLRVKEASKSVPQLIESAGYDAEKHRAVTADGYVLQLHRIPRVRRDVHNPTSFKTKDQKPILLVHGICGDSSNFVLMGPDKSIGYMLADAGYDVWLGNLRGNSNTAHLNYSRDDPEFWEYSFHEHGQYDVPTLIDKVLAVTGRSKLMYMGHSMGITSFLIAMALRPEYNERVLACIALAPAVYMDHMKPLAEFFLKTIKISSWLRSQGMMSASLPPALQDFLISSMCSTKYIKENICIHLVQALVGEDFEQVDTDAVSHMMARVQPISWRQLDHFGKIAITGEFTSWEDGILGRVKPYNLFNVRVPVSLLYGENDQIVQKAQVMRLAHELNKTGILEDVRPGCDWPKFNHADFLFAKDIATLLNKPLVKYVHKLCEKYGE